MTHILIPFNDWSKERLKSGKSATSRNKKYGKPGDTFDVDGIHYKLVKISHIRLVKVAFDYYREEGAISPQEYIVVWNDIHPKKPYRPFTKVWFHEFEVIR